MTASKTPQPLPKLPGARAYEHSERLHREALARLPGGVSSNFRLGGHPVPLFFDRASGSRLYDVDGNAYLDYALGMGPVILGHAPAAVTRAVAAALEGGQLYAGQHRAELELADRLQRLIPCADMVRIGLSGSEMDQAALRVARAATGRRLVVKFEGHYHGWFDTILVSVAPPLDVAGAAESPVPHLPSEGQSAAASSDVAVLPWNDLALLDRFLAAHGSETAGVIMEPILCNTGVILPRPGYLEGVRALCDRHGIVLIFDEVITGFRVGLSGAQGLLGVTPDLAVFAKAMAAGFPVSALAGKRHLMELMATGRVMHGGTYNTNTVSTAAAIATLDELARDDGAVYRQMNRLGERLMDGLRSHAARAGVSLGIMGMGTAFNTYFSTGSLAGEPGEEPHDYRAYRRTDLATQGRFIRALQERGVRVTPRGTWFLSAAHTAADVDETLALAAEALSDLQPDR